MSDFDEDMLAWADAHPHEALKWCEAEFRAIYWDAMEDLEVDPNDPLAKRIVEVGRAMFLDWAALDAGFDIEDDA